MNEVASVETRWVRLRAALAGQAPDAAVEGATAVVSALLGLIGRFIGEELTLRLVEEVWPDLSQSGPSKETT